MAPPLKLDSFDPERAGAAQPDQAVVEAREQGFEAGYRAGWEDCAARETEEQTRIGADFARNLRQMSISYHEIRGHMLRALEPVLRGMVEKVLPEITRQTLGARLLDTAAGMAGDAAAAPVEIAIHPDNRAGMQALLGETPPFPVTLVDEPGLGGGQACLRTADAEVDFDADAMLTAMRAAVDAFYRLQEPDQEKEPQND